MSTRGYRERKIKFNRDIVQEIKRRIFVIEQYEGTDNYDIVVGDEHFRVSLSDFPEIIKRLQATLKSPQTK